MLKTKVFKLNPDAPERKKILLAAEIIKQGGLVIFPTDTVYGLGVNAFLPEARKKIYQLKGRLFNKPLIFLLNEIKQVYPLVENFPEEAKKLVKKFWPGPLSIVFKASALGITLTGGLQTIALRIPDNKIALDLIRTSGVPLATTSANKSGEKSPVSGKEVISNFQGKVDLVIDAGKTKCQSESTILDLSSYPYRILREGYLKKSELEKIMKVFNS